MVSAWVRGRGNSLLQCWNINTTNIAIPGHGKSGILCTVIDIWWWWYWWSVGHQERICYHNKNTDPVPEMISRAVSEYLCHHLPPSPGYRGPGIEVSFAVKSGNKTDSVWFSNSKQSHKPQPRDQTSHNILYPSDQLWDEVFVIVQ